MLAVASGLKSWMAGVGFFKSVFCGLRAKHCPGRTWVINLACSSLANLSWTFTDHWIEKRCFCCQIAWILNCWDTSEPRKSPSSTINIYKYLVVNLIHRRPKCLFCPSLDRRFGQAAVSRSELGSLESDGKMQVGLWTRCEPVVDMALPTKSNLG